MRPKEPTGRQYPHLELGRIRSYNKYHWKGAAVDGGKRMQCAAFKKTFGEEKIHGT